MRAPLVVGLYGRSLIIASVGHRFYASGRFLLLTIDAADTLAAVFPDVLMVDLAELDSAAALALLTDRPELLIVGLDGSGARLLVLGGNQARTLSTDDLVGLIERRVETHPMAT